MLLLAHQPIGLLFDAFAAVFEFGDLASSPAGSSVGRLGRRRGESRYFRWLSLPLVRWS